jgi:hypothetical protein
VGTLLALVLILALVIAVDTWIATYRVLTEGSSGAIGHTTPRRGPCLVWSGCLAMWRLGGLKEAESDLDPTVAGIKNILLGGALLATVASAIAGMRIASQAPEGATPVEPGAEPAPETPEEAARSQRLSAFLGSATVALVAAVLALSSALELRAVERNKGAPCRPRHKVCNTWVESAWQRSRTTRPSSTRCLRGLRAIGRLLET